MDAWQTIKTDPDLLQRLQDATGRPMTTDQWFEQCVSFVYGNLPYRSTLTKEDVRKILRRPGDAQ
jgi:hypothetical protein